MTVPKHFDSMCDRCSRGFSVAISTPSSFAAALARSWLRRDIKKLGRSRRENQGRTNPAVTADRNVSGGHDHGVVCHGITLLGIHCISTWHGTAGLAWDLRLEQRRTREGERERDGERERERETERDNEKHRENVVHLLAR